MGGTIQQMALLTRTVLFAPLCIFHRLVLIGSRGAAIKKAIATLRCASFNSLNLGWVMFGNGDLNR